MIFILTIYEICIFMSCTENDLKDIYLYERLVNIAGTKKYIRKRQQLFIIKDMIIDKKDSLGTKITCGSKAELDLPGSDLDIMVVMKCVDIIEDVRNINRPVQRTTLLMETDIIHPGFRLN